MFPGVQKSTWSYDKTARAWYFHRFYNFQPDLNTSNPHVQAEILKIMGFWIQLGVIGFRMDAVPFVISMKGPRVKKPVEQYDMLRSLREFLQWRAGDSIILARSQCSARNRHGIFWRRRRSHAHDVQFSGQSEFILRAGSRGLPAAGASAQSHETAARDSAMGFVFCAITTSWISAA